MTTQTNKVSGMTEAELVAAEARYNRTVNEGGEGYNPYTAELQDRAAKAHAAAPMTRDDLVRLLDRLDCTIARESGTYDAARCDAIKAQIKAMDDAADAEFAAEWTLETTRTRRAEWNATIKALSETHKGLRFAVAVSAHAKAVGYGTDDLRRAVKMHGL